MKVKICGLTRVEDVISVCELGAWAAGFIFVASSPRFLTLEVARGLRAHVLAPTLAIGVFQDATVEEILAMVIDLRLDGVQLHGAESISFCRKLKELHPDLVILKVVEESASDKVLQEYLDCCDALLLDSSRAETVRRPLDWKRLSERTLPSPLFLAGGLKPSNLQDAIRLVSPQGVDVSSGVESAPGVKDLFLMKEFFRIAKETAL